jgi:hypothetical protein
MQDLAAQKQALTAAHVKYVVLHKPKDGLFAWHMGNGANNGVMAQYPRVYRPVQDGPDMTVLRVY